MPSRVVRVDAKEAASRLFELLRAVAGGLEVEILQAGRPVAKLVPFLPRYDRQVGVDAGRVKIHHDFDDPLPPEVGGSLS